MTRLAINELGRAVARSGVLPVTASFFIEFVRTHVEDLKRLLPSRSTLTEATAASTADLDIAFVLAHLCFASPEFGGGEDRARRNIPYQLQPRRESVLGIKLDSMLAIRPWDRDVLAVNAADLTVEWISGVPIIQLEKRYEKLRAGTLRDMFRTLVSHLTAVADVIAGLLAANDAGELGQEYSWAKTERGLLFRLVRRLRQVARCAVRGVPEDMLWLAELEDVRRRPLCRRPEVVSCYHRNLRTLEHVLDPGRRSDLITALRDVLSDGERWKVIVAGATNYRSERTERRKSSQLRRLPKEQEQLVRSYYTARGTEFESVLERWLRDVGITVTARDGESNRGKSFPDFVLEYAGRTFVVECKSSEGAADVALGDATDVFRKAGIQNLNAEPLVTICHPYVATDVPRKIEANGRLSVVNAEDFAEALVRLQLKRIDAVRFMNWLTTPGQPRSEELG